MLAGDKVRLFQSDRHTDTSQTLKISRLIEPASQTDSLQRAV